MVVCRFPVYSGRSISVWNNWWYPHSTTGSHFRPHIFVYESGSLFFEKKRKKKSKNPSFSSQFFWWHKIFALRNFSFPFLVFFTFGRREDTINKKFFEPHSWSCDVIFFTIFEINFKKVYFLSVNMEEKNEDWARITICVVLYLIWFMDCFSNGSECRIWSLGAGVVGF